MAEVFDGGQEIFDLSGLLRYCSSDPKLPMTNLNRIEDEKVKVGMENNDNDDKRIGIDNILFNQSLVYYIYQ